MSDAVDMMQTVGGASACARVGALVELTKPRIASMVVVTAAAGFLMAQPVHLPGIDFGAFLATLAGIALVGGGANSLNQYIEARFDQLMHRTEGRPLPTGRLLPTEVLFFGVAVSSLGLITVLLWTHPLAALLTAVTLVVYVFAYTPLKRKTPLCVYVGAVPGALPPVIGWAAATGTVATPAWLLFAVMYFWQLPHFAAIAWQYREDYARGGYPMLSVGDIDGMRTCRHMVSHAVALVTASLLPALSGMTGRFYAASAMALGAAFLCSCGLFVWRRSTFQARAVVIASVLYLPLLMATLVIDRILVR